jgi:hypothetical protein
MCKAVEIGKQGDVLRYHPGIKILTKNKSCRLISTQKCHSKEYKIAIFRMCYGENGAVKFLETLADNVFRHSYSMMHI